MFICVNLRESAVKVLKTYQEGALRLCVSPRESFPLQPYLASIPLAKITKEVPNGGEGYSHRL